MLSRRSTDNRTIAKLRHAVLLGVMLALAGCASSGSWQPMAGRVADPADGRGAARRVPPKAMTAYEQAVAVMAAGHFAEAERRFEEFVLQYPKYPGAYVNLAIIRVSNGDDAGARVAIDGALAIDQHHAPALNQLGMLHRRNGNFFEAEATYLKAVTAHPDYALAHYNLGVLNELYLQRLDAALQHFETYQSLVGEDKQVEKWISDLRRRVAAAQRTANVSR